ncbi:CRM-domain containing factor CFM9, mitochondrial [Vitis vinifera]|nr:CRM-domain containing factor CFM9, mitochondrial [Vitis vinifera]|eukprot:XP_002272412.3 PREDICTED: uncharacterized CRM domain-containing protein At3g25440, chloroplastic [Vitis vinifera]
MSIVRNLQRRSLKTLSSLLQSHPYKNVVSRRYVPLKCLSSNPIQSSAGSEDCSSSISPWNGFSGWSRAMSTAGGRSMRSKVERRMRKESGKTLREVRRAQKLRKKLMTDEERLIYNLRRAKKKVALLLQKLKKYELPELPAPRHDPELLTAEQLQAYKKIGFRNKNYVPVGVRGVFGGVVQNMHLHWKFHETVQVCCDNFPKEKIKEMATMLARLSGGIVINVHDVKTIIMFRGRNYRQPKNLIPINTLTKRKALFKARFEQALDSQKLNIKKIEQQLRRMGVNPEDPVAMASIQRVASTFFNAIDKQEGSPYVFQGDKLFGAAPTEDLKLSEEPPVDSDQEELDQFIAEIEDAADKEWAVEEAAEKEELSKMRYWNREEFAGRFRRFDNPKNEDFDSDVRGARGWNHTRGRQRTTDTDDEGNDVSEGDEEWDSNDVRDLRTPESDGDDSDEVHNEFTAPRMQSGKLDFGRAKNNNSKDFKRNAEEFRRKVDEEDSGSEDMLDDLENAMWESDAEEEHDSRTSRMASNDYRSSSDDDEHLHRIKRDSKNARNLVNDHENDADYSESDEGQDEFRESRIAKQKHGQISRVNNDQGFMRNAEANFSRNMIEEDSESENMLSDSKVGMWESDDEGYSKVSKAISNDYQSGDEEEDYHITKNETSKEKDKRMKTPKQVDETWDSD